MAAVDDELGLGEAPRFRRGTDEFSRFCAFADAVFAIAMTLLVLGVAVPLGTNTADLSTKIRELEPQMLSFAISVVVIGFYWIAHHKLVSHLDALNTPFLWTNVLYLGFVAFFPFPTSLIGEFSSELISLVLYAVTAAAVSGMEVVLMLVARRGNLFRVVWPPDVFRYSLIAAGVPVVVFLASIGVAYATSSNLVGSLTWLLSIPGEAVVDSVFKPDSMRKSGRSA